MHVDVIDVEQMVVRVIRMERESQEATFAVEHDLVRDVQAAAELREVDQLAGGRAGRAGTRRRFRGPVGAAGTRVQAVQHQAAARRLRGLRVDAEPVARPAVRGALELAGVVDAPARVAAIRPSAPPLALCVCTTSYRPSRSCPVRIRSAAASLRREISGTRAGMRTTPSPAS